MVRFEMASDIHDRKEIEDSVRREKQLSDSMIDSLPGVFYVFDSTGRLIRWNRNFEQSSGYSHEELARMQATDFFTDDEQQSLAERVQEVFTKGEAVLEADFVSKDGSRTPYVFSGTRVMFGNEPALVGLGLDNSDRKEVVNELKQRIAEQSESQRRLEVLVSGTTEREQRMVDLKQEVNILLKALGRDPKYKTPREVAALIAGSGQMRTM